MNANFFRIYISGTALLLLPLMASCTPQVSDATPPTTKAQSPANDTSVAVASPAPVPEPAATPEPSPPAPQPLPDTSLVRIAPNDPTTANNLPPDIYPTSPLAQVVKLIQAGVDESIVLTYVTNSSGTFNLDSDKIIYLRDIGLPNEAITAMIQRDQQLQPQMTAANPPPAQPTAPETNAEPVSPQPPEDQPTAPPTEVTVNNFYDSLAPYGVWVNIDGYGRCWRPSVVVYNSGWQPYCDHGRWVYTSCGWYWCSDYSWGWAPFHYGRWYQHPRMGWCWTPGTVWGPSWVTWRYANGYCGWAPLPPFSAYRPGFGFFYRGSAVGFGFNWGLNQNCFTFVPTQYFCDPHPRRHCVEPGQVTQVFNQTTVINDFNGQGHHLANRGIDPEHISAITRTPIRPVAIRDTTSPYEHGPRGEQISRDGSTLIVHRPTQPSSAEQNHAGHPTDNRPAPPPQPIRQTQAPVVTTRGPQGDNAIRIPPQRPSAPAGNNSSTATTPNPDGRIYSPRAWEQVHPPQPPRPNSYNSGTPPVTPAPNQGQSGAPQANHHNAPTAAPSQPQPQHNQPVAPPASSSAPRSPNQNQYQSSPGNSPGYNPGNSPGYGVRH